MGDGTAPVARRRDAVRILFILEHAGKPVRPQPNDPEAAGIVKVVKAEKKLQALDFWVRNPDYLASELISLYEKDPAAGAEWLQLAQQVLANGEPDIRRIEMLRYLFGAYEALDDAVATLVTLGFARVKRKIDAQGQIEQRDYCLLDVGSEKAQEFGAHEYLDWYFNRAALVAKVAGTRSGNQLKQRQYDIATYYDARYGTFIQPITKQVEAKLNEILGVK